MMGAGTVANVLLYQVADGNIGRVYMQLCRSGRQCLRVGRILLLSPTYFPVHSIVSVSGRTIQCGA